MAEETEPLSPEAAARAWIDDVLHRHDLARAWPNTDRQLRVVLAQDWIWNHRHDPEFGGEDGWNDLAERLAAGPSSGDGPGGDGLWSRFAGDLMAVWDRSWRGFGTDTWSVRSQPEILDLDLEVITFVDSETGLVRRFVLRLVGTRWLVASVDGEPLFEPGWPPRQGHPSP